MIRVTLILARDISVTDNYFTIVDGGICAMAFRPGQTETSRVALCAIVRADDVADFGSHVLLVQLLDADGQPELDPWTLNLNVSAIDASRCIPWAADLLLDVGRYEFRATLDGEICYSLQLEAVLSTGTSTPPKAE